MGEIKAASLETDFVQKVAEVLTAQIAQMFAAPTVQTTQSVLPTLAIAEAQQPSPTSPAQTRFELLRKLLQTGRLPWWSKPLNRNDLEAYFSQLVSDAPDKLRVLLQSSLKQDQIIQRILYQFSEPMRVEMLKLLAPALHPAFRAYLKDLQRLLPQVESLQNAGSQQLSQTIWQGLLLHLSLRQSLAYPTTKSDINAVLQANLLHVATQLNLDERSLTSIDASSLEGLFNQLSTDFPNILRELLQNSSNQGKVSQANLLAISTLLNPKERSLIQQLLNTGEASQFSQGLANLSPTRDAEVSRYWSALGTISTAGLRQAFLQRAGVLRSHREGWLLQVEHQAHDILLDRLPWSIHVIKLPWMTQVLHTEW